MLHCINFEIERLETSTFLKRSFLMNSSKKQTSFVNLCLDFVKITFWTACRTKYLANIKDSNDTSHEYQKKNIIRYVYIKYHENNLPDLPSGKGPKSSLVTFRNLISLNLYFPISNGISNDGRLTESSEFV
jgi:hypothetical protein